MISVESAHSPQAQDPRYLQVQLANRLGPDVGVACRDVDGDPRALFAEEAQAIEKAIQLSELGLNPQNDGSIIRMNVPPLTEERRKDLVKGVNKLAEDSKVAMRNVRRDANDHLKRLNKGKELSDDEFHIYLEKVDKKLEQNLEELDKVVSAKQKEVMEI